MSDIVDLDEFLEEGWTFRIRGREFTVPEVDWPEYLALAQLNQRIEAAATGKDPNADLTGEQWFELAPRVLGPALDELIKAGVKGATITHLTRSAWFFQLGDRNAADQLLLTLGKAPTPAVEESGSTSTTPTGSTSSESGTGTKRRASTTGTRSRKTSSGRSRTTKDATRTAATV